LIEGDSQTAMARGVAKRSDVHAEDRGERREWQQIIPRLRSPDDGPTLGGGSQMVPSGGRFPTGGSSPVPRRAVPPSVPGTTPTRTAACAVDSPTSWLSRSVEHVGWETLGAPPNAFGSPATETRRRRMRRFRW